jgi:predicted nucleotidyltransferase
MVSRDATSFVFDRIDPYVQKVTPALIEAVTARIIQALRPQRVILFGSQARGKVKPAGDIDFFIQIQDRHPLATSKQRDRSGHVLRLFPYRSFGLDVVVMTHSEVKTLLEVNEGEWDLIIEILKTGKVLYDRAEYVPVE